MTYSVAWAHENNWLVLAVPSCEDFTNGRMETERAKNGLYL